MAIPTELNNSSIVRWSVPLDVSQRTDIDGIRIYRSSSENKDYVALNTVSFAAGSTIPTEYTDVGGNRGYFYLVTFLASGASYESAYQVTFFAPTPRETRLIAYIRNTMPDVITRSGTCNALTDNDYMSGLTLALQIFNAYPPETNFNMEDFPKSHEFFLIGLAQMLTIASRFLPVSIRDWAYSEPGGVTMQVDRGAKMNAAIQVIANVYTQYLPLLKMDFAGVHGGMCATGTIPLPISLGGSMSSSMLNILDIFSMPGR